ncbi:hypothetical protein PspLS_10489 [Pyricularia sp. CBS 133598]|nr:hypothetical protein PspLS_10489 [Pyricularia sp. CBS 133598]
MTSVSEMPALIWLFSVVMQVVTTPLLGLVTSVANLGFISRFDSPGTVPLGGHMSFAEITKKTELIESIAASLMRDAVCRHILCETEPDLIQYTKTSKALREPWFLGFVKAGAEECWGTMLKVR